MTQVTVGENEGIESALRRFKRQVSKAGIFADLKRLRHHETPIEKYKRKAQQRRRRFSWMNYHLHQRLRSFSPALAGHLCLHPLLFL